MRHEDYTFRCIYLYICTYICIHIHIHIYIYVCTYSDAKTILQRGHYYVRNGLLNKVCACVCACMCMCMRARVRACVRVYVLEDTTRPTQSIMYVPLQVNRFQKFILLIVQYNI